MDNKKKLQISYILTFFYTATLVIGGIYSDALFLIYYPQSWLTFYFFINALVLVSLNIFIAPFLSRASQKTLLIYNIGSITTLLILAAIMFFFDSYLMPFIVSVVLSFISVTIYVIGSNAVITAFDIYTYKLYAVKFGMLTTIGSIAAAAGAPLLVHFFTNKSLMLATLILLVASTYSIYALPMLSQESNSREQQKNSSLLKQPLFNYILLMSLSYGVIYYVMQFAFNNVLMGSFSPDGLTTFLSLYKLVTNIAVLAIQLFFAERLIIILGIGGILIILPIMGIVLGIPATIWAGLPAFVLFRGIYQILTFSLSLTCMDMLINPFPTMMRNAANFYLKGYVRPAISLLVIPLIYVLNHYLALYWSMIVIIISSFVFLYSVQKAHKAYRETLHESLVEKRYNTDLLFESPEELSYMEREIIETLQSKELAIVDTALSCFENKLTVSYFNNKEMGKAILPFIANPNATIRYKAALAIKNLGLTGVSGLLIKPLEIETDEQVAWMLIDTLIKLEPEIDIQELSAQTVSNPYYMALEIIFMLRSNSLDLKKKAENLLEDLRKEKNIQNKLLLSNIARYIPNNAAQEKHLIELIQDKDTRVSIAALNAVNADESETIIPYLTALLGSKPLSHYAALALVRLKEKSLPTILGMDISGLSRTSFTLIQILASTNEAASLEKLIQISKTDWISLRLAVAQNLRSNSRKLSSIENFEERCMDMIDWLSYLIQELMLLKIPANNPILAHEVDLQIKINRSLFLIWFGFVTNPQSVIAAEKYILNPEKYQQLTGNAYVLLDSISTNAVLRQAILRISPVPKAKISIEAMQFKSPQLQQLSIYPQSQPEFPMNIMDKTALLRMVSLFAEVPIDSLRAIAEVTEERDMSKKEALFHEGDTSDRFYVIVSGSVDIVKSGQILASLVPGDFFGELGLLDDSARAGDAIATQDGMLLYIEKDRFIQVLEDLPEVMRAVVKQLIIYFRKNARLMTA